MQAEGRLSALQEMRQWVERGLEICRRSQGDWERMCAAAAQQQVQSQQRNKDQPRDQGLDSRGSHGGGSEHASEDGVANAQPVLPPSPEPDQLRALLQWVVQEEGNVRKASSQRLGPQGQPPADNMLEVPMPQWSVEAMSEAVRFMYRGCVEVISLPVTQELWLLSGLLQLPLLQERLQQVLLDCVQEDNCVLLLRFAAEHRNDMLFRKSLLEVQKVRVLSRQIAEEMMSLADDVEQICPALEAGELRHRSISQLMEIVDPSNCLSLLVRSL